ncbi:MAG: hypothetical protein ACI89Z_001424, partial [Porticoccus sp.]
RKRLFANLTLPISFNNAPKHRMNISFLGIPIYRANWTVQGADLIL